MTRDAGILGPAELPEGALVEVDEVWSGSWRGRQRLRVAAGLLVPVHPADAAGPALRIPGTILPRLVDSHVHLGLIDAARLMSNGITEVHDLGWLPSALAGWRIRSAAEPARFPAVRAAGAFVTCVGGYPRGRAWAPPGCVVEVASVRDADRAVRTMSELGADFIKVTLNSDDGPVLDDELLRALVRAAHTLAGLPVVVHAQGVGQAARALAAGADTLAHTPFSETLDDELVSRMAGGMSWISTLDIHGHGAPSAELRIAQDNLRRFAAAGGTVRYGTDLGNGPLPVGVNERELVRLSEAGLDREALVRAIAGPSRLVRGPAGPGAGPAVPVCGPAGRRAEPAERRAEPARRRAEPALSTPLPPLGPRFAWIPTPPPSSALETAHWLARARGATLDTLPRSV